MTLIQPIDFAYFKTTYFWVTTAMAIILAVYVSWKMDEEQP